MVKPFRWQRSNLHRKITGLFLLSLLVTLITASVSVPTTLAAPIFSSPATAAQGRLNYDANIRIRKDGLAFLVGSRGAYINLTVLNNGGSYAGSVDVGNGDDNGNKYPYIAFSPVDGTGYVTWNSLHPGSGITYETYIRVIPAAYNGTSNTTLGSVVRLFDKIGYQLAQPSIVVDSAGHLNIVGYAALNPVQLRMVTLDSNFNLLSQTTLDTQPAGARAEMDPIICIDRADNLHVATSFPYGTSSDSPVRLFAYDRVNSGSFVKTSITPSGWSTVAGRRGKDIACAADGTVYVATNNGGKYDLFKRTAGSGGSEKWAQIQSNLFGKANQSGIAVGTSLDGRVWAVQGDGANSGSDPTPIIGTNVKYSTDGGKTFSANERAIPQNYYANYAVAIDGNGPGNKVHLVGSFYFISGNGSITTSYAVASVNGSDPGPIPTPDPGTPGPTPTPEPTPPPTTPPSGVSLIEPTDLHLTVRSSNRVDLVWMDNSTGEDGFHVERKGGGKDWSEIGTTGADDTSYTDNSASMNTAYTYRVRASKGSDFTDYSNESSATTLGPASLTFSAQPGTGAAGQPLSQQPKVNILDKNGNLVTNFTGQVTLALANNPSGATLSGNAVTVSGGIATFTGVQLDKAGDGYTLTATANPAAANNATTSIGFNVAASGTTPPPPPVDLGQDQRDAPIALAQFQSLWDRSDKAIVDGKTSRSWTWGPSITGLITEPYAEGGTRQVQYFDKTRMEQTSGRDVTNGLLAKELVTGLMQLGDNTFKQYPADNTIKIAGDQNAPQNPTYAMFRKVSTIDQENHAPSAGGSIVNLTMSKDGTVGSDDALGAKYNVKNQYFDNTLQHNVPDVFWNFMNQTGPIYVNGNYTTGPVVDWLSTMGLPLSEAYWTRTVVAGVEQDVLVQIFERRVLTYTPSNPDGYKVEMGNVGQHYREWRKAVLTAPSTVTGQ
ncbi:MAG: fibronectin type III domain-containing protein [Chloroflexi bacterium]|nr:fibronectin type III domain-containing protein [Chloroflexota bacterium]